MKKVRVNGWNEFWWAITRSTNEKEVILGIPMQLPWWFKYSLFMLFLCVVGFKIKQEIKFSREMDQYNAGKPIWCDRHKQWHQKPKKGEASVR